MKSNGINNKVRVKPFVHKFLLQSDGMTGWRYIEIEDTDIEDWGPHLEQITIHAMTETRSANHHWKVVIWHSTDGRNWSTPTDLIAAEVQNGDIVYAPFADVTTFGIKIKLGLAVSNVSGTAMESAVVTVAGAFRFLS